MNAELFANLQEQSMSMMRQFQQTQESFTREFSEKFHSSTHDDCDSGVSGETGEDNDDSDDGQQEDFRNAALQIHNSYRAQHGGAPLTLSNKLNQVAQNYAQHLADINSMVHSTCGFGENLYNSCGTGHDASESAKAATKAWYDEISLYNWDSPEHSSGTGHFTQVVWKGSSELGVGVATNGQGATFVVANYNPAGNFQGAYEENVTP